MGTARHKHNSKLRIKRIIYRIDSHERDNLPGKRILWEDMKELQEQGLYPCGYARMIHLYNGKYIGLCALTNSFRRCSHENFIFKDWRETCPTDERYQMRRRN